ncbi:hypothetical protein HPB51_008317 [Rhipicephalus microplus]|uniref:Integrin alpha third immunoglobulin-like domain-containing protein n=1 Tax=Rhipicephalus microplus TaxID=6941 RepID=A0A9J6EZY3_RHIMP|nr:hypothetical protein HPB51_008317 [Rhipicephalus microplus]
MRCADDQWCQAPEPAPPSHSAAAAAARDSPPPVCAFQRSAVIALVDIWTPTRVPSLCSRHLTLRWSRLIAPLTGVCHCSMAMKKQSANAAQRCSRAEKLNSSDPEAIFLLKLDMSQVADTFNLTAEATSTSEEATPNDNKVVIELPFVHKADISMLGKAKPEVVTFNAATKNIELEHGFVLAKLYASPIQQVQLSIRVPYVFSETEKPIAYVRQIRVLQGDSFVPGSCRNMEGVVKSIDGQDQAGRNSEDDSRTDVLASRNGSLGGRVQRSVPEHESPRSEKLTALLYQNVPPLNCKTSLCHEVRCNFGPFLNRQKIAQIILTVVVNMEEFIRQAGSWYAFSVGSEGYLKILDNTTFLTDPNSRKEIRVATVFQKEGPPPAQKVATWIIAASAFSWPHPLLIDYRWISSRMYYPK